MTVPILLAAIRTVIACSLPAGVDDPSEKNGLYAAVMAATAGVLLIINIALYLLRGKRDFVILLIVFMAVIALPFELFAGTLIADCGHSLFNFTAFGLSFAVAITGFQIALWLTNGAFNITRRRPEPLDLQ